jgi:hypothetical protein
VNHLPFFNHITIFKRLLLLLKQGFQNLTWSIVSFFDFINGITKHFLTVSKLPFKPSTYHLPDCQAIQRSPILLTDYNKVYTIPTLPPALSWKSSMKLKFSFFTNLLYLPVYTPQCFQILLFGSVPCVSLPPNQTYTSPSINQTCMIWNIIWIV